MSYKYDIAISFSSEILEHAKKISSLLEAEGLKVFFDRKCQEDMYSEKINEKLYNVYKNESCLRVILLSERYLEKEITKFEQRIILNSAKDEKNFLIVNFSTKIKKDEKYENLVYIDGSKMYDDEIAIEISNYFKRIAEGSQDNVRHLENDMQNITIHNHGVITGDCTHINSINL